MKPGCVSESTNPPRTHGLHPPWTGWVITTAVFSTLYFVFMCLFYVPFEMQIRLPLVCVNLLLLVPLGLALGTDPTDPLSRTPEDKQTDVFCIYCDTNVHETSKHCRVCTRCVHGFDHHCKWLNTCVGKANYSYFFTTIAYFCCLMVVNGSQALLAILDETFSISSLHLYFFFMLNVVPFTPVTHLLGFHIYLCFTGKTTYECIVAKRKKIRPKFEASEKYKKTLDKGLDESNTVDKHVNSDEV